MELNLTLLGQMITFGIFIWFTMRFVWPMLESALDERKKKITDGLAAAEKGHKTLEKAEDQVKHALNESKVRCAQIIEDANKQATQILEEAKVQAQREHNDIVEAGHANVKQAMNQARTELQTQVANIVVLGAEKILARSVNADDHREMLDSLAKGLR
jgi:F-type H+-transporting ATPase subunit b